jgi:transcriptional regulator with XRE-family HTH domain
MNKNKLKLLRLNSKLTQDEMAEALYISQNAYSLIECGKTRLVDTERIKVIAKKLAVNPMELGLFDELELKPSHQDEDADFITSDLENKRLMPTILIQIEQLLLQNAQLMELIVDKSNK